MRRITILISIRRISNWIRYTNVHNYNIKEVKVLYDIEETNAKEVVRMLKNRI